MQQPLLDNDNDNDSHHPNPGLKEPLRVQQIVVQSDADSGSAPPPPHHHLCAFWHWSRGTLIRVAILLVIVIAIVLLIAVFRVQTHFAPLLDWVAVRRLHLPLLC